MQFIHIWPCLFVLFEQSQLVNANFVEFIHQLQWNNGKQRQEYSRKKDVLNSLMINNFIGYKTMAYIFGSACAHTKNCSLIIVKQ